MIRRRRRGRRRGGGRGRRRGRRGGRFEAARICSSRRRKGATARGTCSAGDMQGRTACPPSLGAHGLESHSRSGAQSHSRTVGQGLSRTVAQSVRGLVAQSHSRCEVFIHPSSLILHPCLQSVCPYLLKRRSEVEVEDRAFVFVFGVELGIEEHGVVHPFVLGGLFLEEADVAPEVGVEPGLAGCVGDYGRGFV